MSSITTIDDVRIVSFPARPSEESNLYVYEHGECVPFQMSRVFVVDSNENCKRGHHAHYECQQLLVCLRGKIKVKITDGNADNILILDDAEKGILIPSGLWAEQEYQSNSLLMVLTDQKYNEEDYIRNYNDFLRYKGK